VARARSEDDGGSSSASLGRDVEVVVVGGEAVAGGGDERYKDEERGLELEGGGAVEVGGRGTGGRLPLLLIEMLFKGSVGIGGSGGC
jgi:hypothetical protein